MSAPKPTPDAWDAMCPTCERRIEIQSEYHARHYQSQMLGCGPVVRPAALWGERWADVARLVAAVQLGASYLEGHKGPVLLSKVDVSGFVSRWRWALGTTPRGAS